MFKKLPVKLILFFLICLVGIFFYIAKDRLDLSMNNTETGLAQTVSLPDSVLGVHRGTWHEGMSSFLFSAENIGGGYGVWQYHPENGFKNLLSVEDKFFYGKIFVDSKGVIYYSANLPGVLYRSADDGETWQVVQEKIGVFWGITEDEAGNLYGSLWSENRPLIFKSIDNGLTWNLWQDFSTVFPDEAVLYNDNDERFKLRHLHDIVAVENDILVGTGDVTRWGVRTGDDGKSWKKAWDEGFTSSVFDSKNRQVIFGADLPGYREKGIAVYDVDSESVEEVWNPSDISWPGYIYTMIEQGDVFYAAVHVEENNSGEKQLYGILYSEDGKTWKKLIEFETSEVVSELFLLGVLNNNLYFTHNGELKFVSIASL